MPGEVSRGDLEAAVTDFIDALELLNRELNGDPPSESVGATDLIPRVAAYAAFEVERMLEEVGERRHAREVKRAWGWVLDGDIDGLVQEGEWDDLARGDLRE